MTVALRFDEPRAPVAASVASRGRVLLVSNRLPFTAFGGDDSVELRRSSGGLVSALERVHDRPQSLWIGSLGAVEPTGPAVLEVTERLRTSKAVNVPLSQLEVDGFYRRYANGILWPALHGLPSPSPRDRCGWGMYRAVNERFAAAVAKQWRDGDTVWIHDYQLMLLPALLRQRRPDARIGFFLHTPLPRREWRESVPEWNELLAGMLGADVVGFQTRRDAEHFVDAAGGRYGRDGDEIGTVARKWRTVRVVAAPIGVDHDSFGRLARHPQVLVNKALLRVAGAGPLFVGVDRLDYTKAIPERLLAFDELLSTTPELRGRARFIQVAVPSREDVGGYMETRLRVAGLVNRINRRHQTADWQPIEYIHGTIDAHTLVGLYTAADVMVVTPLRDGMNLVAKEFVASRVNGGGRLVLSRGAGAAAELRDAILVDGDDPVSVAQGYRRALALSATEARSRMRAMRAAVAANDVFAWADSFVGRLNADI